eukprot:CAMPEP_0197524326 /NCGR_PEP_ID=MMETSP1318-20131121/9029_1 /TAXON_ID=552666 /ORGANISM="Partenskyella glossopodia, Strain RCC365" /LENGTH=96 /DNA_ID=CAMNT_0043077257 /DNA_START=60 /DNA_END=351 /DNA_ORIENTATION=-
MPAEYMTFFEEELLENMFTNAVNILKTKSEKEIELEVKKREKYDAEIIQAKMATILAEIDILKESKLAGILTKEEFKNEFRKLLERRRNAHVVVKP